MAMANKTLFIAGYPDVVNEEIAFYNQNDPKFVEMLKKQRDALEGKKGGMLYVVSASDGKKLAEYKLNSPPVFDSIALAKRKLYMTLQDGHIICMGE